MNWKKGGIYFFIFLCGIIKVSHGQDVHFSQFFNAPSSVNPALTGFTNSRIRAFANHRNQWASVTLPFKTYAATLDAQLLKRKQKGDMLGVGISAFSDKAGDSEFGTNSASFSMSYVRALGQYSARNLIGFGVQVSYAQRSLDYQKLLFDNQFNGTQYDPNLKSGELFAVDNFQYFDIAAGVNWFTHLSYEANLSMGLSVWHINRPVQSLKDDNKVRLSIKGIFHAESEINIAREYQLIPALLVQQQGTYNEVIIGSRFKIISDPKPHEYKAILTGLFFRNRDAIITYVGYQLFDFTFGLSYDFNISTLSPASRYLGGIELNINWKLPANRQPKQKDLPCPIF